MHTTLNEVRQAIDSLDQQLIELLAQRQRPKLVVIYLAVHQTLPFQS